MNTFVIDASIAVKWVVEEDNTAEALTLRRRAKLIAPELLLAECANILWKKVERNELSQDEALLAARLLQAANIECLPVRSLIEVASRSSSTTPHMTASTSLWRTSASAGLSPPTSASCAN